VPRSAIGIGILVGLLVGGVAGAIAGIWLARPLPGGRSLPFVLGSSGALLGTVFGAILGAFYNLANRLIGGRPVPPDGPEADYRDLVDPPG
jgi:hypothetical protein